MNAPITRPLHEIDEDQYVAETAIRLNAERGSSLSSLIKKNSDNDNSSNKYGPWICIAIGAACFSLGFSIPAFIQARDTRAELLQEIQRSEARVLADNREKTTQFTLLDSHYRELKAMVEAREKVNERRR